MLSEYYEIVLANRLQSSIENFKFYLTYLFENVSFMDKRVLDIGGGSGYLSFYAACLGARDVTCLDPEASGTNPELNKAFYRFQSRLPGAAVEYVAHSIQDYEGQKEFDLILMHNSINHMIEGCPRLRRDENLREKALQVFAKVFRYCRAGADLIIVDNSRYHLFQLLGLRNPFAPHIGWKHHETPEFWTGLLEQVGFKRKRLCWGSFNTLRRLGRVFMNNPFAAYVFGLPFILTMHRPE